MATNIPPHNLREIGAGVQWALANPGRHAEELLDALLAACRARLPHRRPHRRRSGIEEAYRTGRGSVRMRAVVEVDEDAKGRTILVVSELPLPGQPGQPGRVDRRPGPGRQDRRHRRRPRRGLAAARAAARHRAQARRRRQGGAEQPLQAHPAAVHLRLQHARHRRRRPAHAALDQFVEYYVAHQVDVIVRRTRFQLRKAEERAHILRALGKALDRLDDVIALIRRSASAEAARSGLMELLDIDEIQAVAILDMQLRRLAASSGSGSWTSWPSASARSPSCRPSSPTRAGSADHRRGARRDRRAGTATSGAPASSPSRAT
jgi:DNA gyrase subunit A